MKVYLVLALAAALARGNDICDEVAVEAEVRQCQASGHSRVNIVEAGADAQVLLHLRVLVSISAQ